MVPLEWLLGLAFLAGGLNDLFLDLVFYVGPLRRALAQGRTDPRCDESELHGREEQAIAILIPAWDERAVIGAMLESTADRLDYAHYDIFVGTYPNDEPTQFEVARAAFDRPRIHRVVCPHDGPTSKADCLNWIVEAVRLHETETGRSYQIFTLQDAEDVVHPLALKVFNRFIPEYDCIQLPVIPYERALHKLTGNTYLDEFAEVHLKGLSARLAVGGMVPSAAVGTGFSRAACEQLAEQTQHVLFPPGSLTEDYDFSFRLFRNGRRSGLAEVWVDRQDARRRHVKELVAIREFFPAHFAAAVRQKQRWLLGITFQGTQRLGWGRGWRERFMLLRDRIGVVTSGFNLLAAFLLFRQGELMVEAHLHHLPWTAALPPVRHGDALALLLDVNLLLLVNRIAQRGFAVARVARRRQALMTPVRMLWSNLIDLHCVFHAIRRFVHTRWTGKPLRWHKTAHEYPSVETLLRRHRPLGDILLERRVISPDQLTAALAVQARPAGRGRYLGEILADLCAVTQEQLLAALSLQTRAKAELSEPVTEMLLDREATPLLINLVVKPASGMRRAEGSTRGYPSQLAAAPSLHSGMGSDPVARLSRGRPRVPLAGVVVRTRRLGAAPESARRALDLSLPAAPAPPPCEESTSLTLPQTTACPEPPVMAREMQPRRFRMLQAVAQNLPETGPNKRFVVVIGTRPEAIKLAPLIAELRGRARAEQRVDDVFVCVTGQHGAMVREPLALFGITPDADLGVMRPGQSLASLSARVLEAFAQVLARLEPDWVVVQGDTATTAMAALAAFYAGVKVAHVEAGLRTHNLQNPFPEEANRRMVTLIASMHFAATEVARKNLLREGVREHTIRVTGNTGIDALRLHCERIGLPLCADASGPLPASAGLAPARPIRVLVTAHRRENLAEGIRDLCIAIRALVRGYPGRFQFVWPLHPNPDVARQARQALTGLRDVTLSEAVPYDRLLGFLAQCDLVVTDSGGLQEEAPSFGKPVLILRTATERPEGVYAGLAQLVGTAPRDIQEAVLEKSAKIEKMRSARAMDPRRPRAHSVATRKTDIPPRIREVAPRSPANPYGDGCAAMRIADFFGDREFREFQYPALGSERSAVGPPLSLLKGRGVQAFPARPLAVR